jgi:hypothetical protein
MALFDNIKNAIQDISSLEVATLTNSSTGKVDLNKDTGKEVFTAIRNSLTQSELVAYTRFELDGDAVNFISGDTANAPLIDKHTLLVTSALATRKALFESIFQSVKEFVKP